MQSHHFLDRLHCQSNTEVESDVHKKITTYILQDGHRILKLLLRSKDYFE